MKITTEKLIALWNDFCDENDLYFERLRTENECFDELETWCSGADFGTYGCYMVDDEVIHTYIYK